MTNPLPVGTVNLSANAPADFAAELRRAAYRAGVSFGEFMRRLLITGAAAEDPALADRLREIRRQYYGAALLTLFLGLTVHAVVTHQDETSRRSRSVRRVRVEECVEAEEI